jgi:hypothetical protein
VTFPAILVLLLAPAPRDLALYIPFDSDAAPVLGGMRVTHISGEPDRVPGLRAEAADLTSDCRLQVGGPFPQGEGTFALWMKPGWPGGDQATHYLLSLYGDPGLPDCWLRNRFSLAAAGGRLSFTVFGAEAGQQWVLPVDAPTLTDGAWHHVAVTWEGVNNGPGAATLRMYMDGQCVAEQAGQAISMGPSASLLDLGRDSDASPDYAQALVDDVFLYSRALTASEISVAVSQVLAGAGQAPVDAGPRARSVPGWLFPELPCRIEVTVPVREEPLGAAVGLVRLSLAEQLRAMGLPASLDPARMRFVSADTGAEVGSRWSAPVLEWSLGPGGPGDPPRRLLLYFAAHGYDYLGPLLVAGPPAASTDAGDRTEPAEDYALSAYGDAWDFDEGDTEEIDAFGDKPEYIRDVRVASGVLTAHVLEDPYIIWGSMWGPEDAGHRRVRIDVSRHNLLVMRVRQSVETATWRIFGRPVGSDQLLQYEFPVTGTQWQTIRIGLRRDARWAGTLSAFRIDPTEKVEADVSIDCVWLLPSVQCQAGAVETLGNPSSEAAHVALTVPDVRPVAGSEQEVVVRVLDGTGAPVAGQPVVLWLSAGSAGRLLPADQPALALPDGRVRGITGADGGLRARLVAGAKVAEASATVLAAAEFPTIEAVPVPIATVPGPPDHYVVLTGGVTIVPEADAPLPVPAYVADACGNRLSVAGRRLTWSVDGGRLEQAQEATDAAGSASARLVPDMADRWVYHVRVQDDQGLSGMSGDICVLPRGPWAEPVRLGGNGYFVAGAAPFLPLGGFYAVWIPRPAPPGQEEGRVIAPFTSASEEDVHHWFGFLRSQGVTAMRLMLRTHGPDGTEAMDVGGRVNRRLFAKVLRLLDIGRQCGLRFMLTLHDDYDKPVYCNERHLRNFALPALEGVDLDTLSPSQRRFLVDQRLLSPPERYTAPDAIACQDQYTREIVGYLRDNPALFAWELENEMVNCPVEWVNHQVDVIRSVDAITPVCVSHGGGGVATADPLWWTTRSKVDFYTYHLYPLGTTTPEVDYGAGVDLLARYGRMAGTCFLGESVGDEFNDYPAQRDADRRYIARDIIWLSLVNANPGCFFWNARGTELAEFRLVHEVTSKLDWTTWRRKRPPVAVLVTHPVGDDRYYATPQGQADWAMMGRYCQHFLSSGQDFDFATDPGGYQATCDLSRFAPPAQAGQPLLASEGFQLASLTREDGREGLVYVRSFAGVRPWEVSPGRTMYLRGRAPAPLQMKLGLPLPKVTARIWDLDTGGVESRDVAGDGVLDLGTTDHDFAILWSAAE